MSKSIIQQLQNGVPLEELYRMFDKIPLQDLEETIRSTDLILKEQVSHHSQLLHTNMQSHHNMGSINTIKKSFNDIEKYLKYIVRNNLSVYHRFVIAFTEFFGEYISQEQLDESMTNIQRAKHEIFVYNTVLVQNTTTFFKYLDMYNKWVKVLNTYIPILSRKHGDSHAALFLSLSRFVMQASEFLTTQQQLKLTVELQMQNNQIIVNDISHVVSVSQNLIKNIMSARLFFKQEYIGSIKIIEKYR